MYKENTSAAAPPLEASSGDPAPAWPLPGICPVHGAPTVCTILEHEHAGVDLPNAPPGTEVISPEDATIVRADYPWNGDARAMLLRTRTGLLLLLGGFAPGSHHELGHRDGAVVRKGDALGRVGSFGALHVEVHDGRGQALPPRWWRGDRPPDGLRNAAAYVARMPPRRQCMPRLSEAEFLQQWRTLQSRRNPMNAAAAARLQAAVKALIDRLQPPRDAADAFLRNAPAGWRERMELLLDADPLVPNLAIAASRRGAMVSAPGGA